MKGNKFGLGRTAWNKGIPHTEEAKIKMRINHKGMLGQKHTKEWKEQMCKRFSGEGNPMHNKKYTSEEKIKKSKTMKEFFMNHPESREKISITHRGKKLTIERRENLRQFHMGLKHSEATKQKLREARLKQKFPTKFTSIELKIKSFLDELHIPYKTHKAVMGVTQPDFFIEPNICIYCDGDYWHNLPSYIERDKKINEVLKFGGFKVIRIWEHDIKVMKLNDLKEIL